jgi:hypothetical protein
MQTAQKLETFTGVVENTIPARDIGWIRADSGETLFFHVNYILDRKMLEVGARVKGRIGRVPNEERQARAFAVEVVNGH